MVAITSRRVKAIMCAASATDHGISTLSYVKITDSPDGAGKRLQPEVRWGIERAAVSFFNSDRGKLYFSHARERYYRYDEKTGEMVVASNGVIHTYMQTGKKYFIKVEKQDKLEEVQYERMGGMPYLRNKV